LVSLLLLFDVVSWLCDWLSELLPRPLRFAGAA